jgi:proteasome lid subunit RPN8/RPN11
MWNWFNLFKPKSSPVLGLVWVLAAVLDRSVEIMKQTGFPGQPHEGVVYWAGRRIGLESFVTTCIAPPTRTTRGSFATSSQANAKVIMYLGSNNLELIGQVHSHPGAFVGHSLGDDQGALMPYDGFLSIVVPHYARRGMRPLTMCGVHLFEGARFRQLPDSEIESRFHVVPNFADLRNQ